MRIFPFLGLRGRLILLLLTSFFILFTIPVWHYFEELDQQMDVAKSGLVARTRLIAARQEFLVHHAEDVLNSIAASSDVGLNASGQGCQPYLASRLTQEPDFSQMSKALPNGDIVCAAVSPGGLRNVADRLYFQRAIETREMVLAEVVMGRILQKPIIIFSKSVRNAKNEVTSVLLLALGLDWLQNELAKTELPKEARLTVLDAQGVVISRYPDPEAWTGKSAAQSPAIQQLLNASSASVFESTTWDGTAKIFAHTPLLATASGSQYHLLLSIPKQVIEAPVRREALIGLGVMLAVLVGMVAFVLSGGHRLLLQPLLKLSETAACIKSGDLTARSGLPHGGDTIGRLAETLDHAAAAIEERDRQLAIANQEMAHLNQTLQSKVDVIENKAALLAQTSQELQITHATLQNSEARYRTLVEMSPNAVVVQREGTLLYVNVAAAKLFGAASAADLEGKPVINFIHPKFRQLALGRFKLIAQPGDSVPIVQEQLLKLDGAVMDVEIQSVGIVFNDKLAIQIYIHDLTERTRRLAELSVLRSEMHTMLEWQVARHTVAALAHEINQPLASLSVLCEVASRMLATDRLPKEAAGERVNRLEQTLQRMASETERAGSVVRQLMKSVNQPDITLAPVMLCELLHEVERMVQDEGVFDCQIEIDCATNIKSVQANRLQLTKVLMNLISNSAQAMNSAQIVNGKLWINAALAADGTEIRVSVRDEGPGISAKLPQNIFQPFVTTKSDGLGMGLTISRALVEAHGGKLWHEKHVGPGATFHFTLPTSSLSP